MYSKNAVPFAYLRGIVSLMILLWVSGCGKDNVLTGNSAAPLKMEFRMAPSVSAQVNVTSIELTVSGPDMDEPRLYQITDISPAESTARGLISVPVGSGMTFSARAFEAGCPALSGIRENVEIIPDENPPISIELGPIQINVGVRSQQAQVSVGANYDLEVYIEDAPSLFAFTCELEFNENLLNPLEIVPGDFFGTEDDILFIEDSQLPRTQENRLVLGVTRKDGAPGVCGSGTAFRITFGTSGAGNATVQLLRNENLTLSTPAFERIEDSRIIIGTVASVAVSP
jgi:hypothetical protein